MQQKAVISCVLILSAFLSSSSPGSLSPINVCAQDLPSSIHLDISQKSFQETITCKRKKDTLGLPNKNFISHSHVDSGNGSGLLPNELHASMGTLRALCVK